jgi:hypothetical protein
MRLLLASALLLVSACSSDHSDERHRPLDRLHQDPRCAETTNVDMRAPQDRVVGRDGVVSSESIAKQIAYSYLNAVYPKDITLRRMTATLSNGVWIVNGTLPKDSFGGVAGIAICQSNGRVLEVAHGR